MSTKAYSYLRFSTPDQMKGDSFRRQTALAEDYAARHGLDLDLDLTFRDLGVSAFRGKNAEAGRLADFLEAVDDGLVPPGSFLLVESLDRISRQAARKALRVLEDIADRGVTVVTLNDGRSYDRDALDRDPMALLLALLTFIRANEESETKSRRLRAAWIGKRAKAAEKPLTSICPAWLRHDAEGGQIEVVEERAEVVRRIFRLALAGVGLNGIATALNADGVPTFGHNGRKAEVWGRSYVAKIAANPAVYGVLVPHVLEHVDGVKRRKALDPVPGYYPAVVTEADFHALQAARLGDHKARHRKGASPPVSVVAGLAECPVCGGTMTRVAKGRKGGKPRLVCVRAKTRRCYGRSVVLDDVERAMFARADEIAATAPVGGEDLQAEIEKLDVEADVVRGLMEDAEADWRASRSPAARARMTRLEAEWDAAQAARKAAEERRAAAGPGLVRRLAEYREAIAAQPLDRPRVNALLRQMLAAVVVDPAEGTLRLRWHGGVESAVAFAWGLDGGPVVPSGRRATRRA